ncbi:MAG: curli-like amyloid fiber formation chaperone CsgH [Sulfitobacter sp.]|jgi:hypothetical protein
MKRNLLAIAALLFSATGGAAGDQSGGGAADAKKAWIEISEADRMVTIEVMSDLDDDVGGTYRLEVKKAGASGTSVNRQSGTIQVNATEKPQSSSVSRVSVEMGAELEVLLSVEDTAGQIHEDRFFKVY